MTYGCQTRPMRFSAISPYDSLGLLHVYSFTPSIYCCRLDSTPLPIAV